MRATYVLKDLNTSSSLYEGVMFSGAYKCYFQVHMVIVGVE